MALATGVPVQVRIRDAAVRLFAERGFDRIGDLVAPLVAHGLRAVREK